MTKCSYCEKNAGIVERTGKIGGDPHWACESCFVETQLARTQVILMKEPQLQELSFDILKWTCCIEGCDRFTRIKDYSCTPYYHWRKKWWNLRHSVFYCGKHWQYFKRVPEKLIYKPGNGEEHLKPNQ